MAKKKKKARIEKNASSGQAPQAAKAPSLSPSTAPDTQSLKTGVEEDSPSPRSAQKGVRYSFCIAGMLLTFILGIYLGTLLPGLHLGEAQKVQVASQSAPQTMPPAQDTEMQRTIADLEKKAAANLESAPEWINLGNIYFDAHMPEKAIDAYEHALKLAPKNADVLTDLGIMYRETGQYEKAVECFRKAISIEPGHRNAMYNEGVVLSSDLHRKEEAEKAWQRLLEFYPQANAPNGVPISEMIKQLR